MSVALDHLEGRPFSFYPPILHVEHNQWVFRSSTWSEVLVMNTKSRSEVWVPRQYLGEVSCVEDPVMIVGLRKELEYRAGAVWPHERRVIEMPRAVGEGPRPLAVTAAPEPRPAPVVGIRLESGAESRVGRLILGALVLGVVACVLGVSLFRYAGSKVTYRAVYQADPGFRATDDFVSIVRQWGTPAADKWSASNGALQYRVLAYPDRQVSIVLMGTERDKARYIGAVDRDGNPVHVVPIANGGDTGAMLRGLKRF